MRLYLIVLFILGSAQCMGQLDTTRYRKEVFSFMDQVLHDTTHYTYDMYIRDSLELAEKCITDKEAEQQMEYLKYYPDTCTGLIRIKTGQRGDCLNDFVLSNRGGIGYAPEGFKDQGKDLDSVYSEFASFYGQDSLFFHSFVWPMHFQGLVVAPDDTIRYLSKYGKRTALKERYGVDDEIHLAMPIFNSDYTKAVFVYNYWSNGHCSFGETLFFRKVAGKWIFIRSPTSWIS